MAQRMQITIDLGANAPIEVIRQVVDDLDTVCQFGGELQYRVALAEAQGAVLSNPSRWIPGFQMPTFPQAGGGFQPTVVPPPPPSDSDVGKAGFTPLAVLLSLSPFLAPAVSRYMDENNSTEDTITRVESIRYSNPIELVVTLGPLTVVALGMLARDAVSAARDWSGRRRVNAAIADDFESAVLTRKRLRDHLIKRVVDEDQPLPASVIDELLTLDVARAMRALGDSQLRLHELAAGEGKPASE